MKSIAGDVHLFVLSCFHSEGKEVSHLNDGTAKHFWDIFQGYG
jgi:hypothetical protein